MENHLPKLIIDLALILGAGAVTTLLFKRIKQPVILGYIIAGFLVGPHFTFIPNVAEKENIKIWAELGVLFLLFNLGLEFSFKKLINVGGTASITGIVEIISVTVLGYLAGQWMGWNMMNSIFLGGILAASSTTIILRTFDELGVKRKNFARVVFGVLVVEDIVVVLLMVLLSTMAISQEFNAGEMLTLFLKLLFFLALWFVFGIFLIPSLLRSVRKFLDEETRLVLSLALCLGMAVLATNIGFSAELGAFVMGSILAETTSAEKIEHSLKPVKDLFGAIFFVSIGMMIDPVSMYEYRWEILGVTLLLIFGKVTFATIGAVLSGQPLKQSIRVGMSLAVIGEFAFIVATLGMNLKVTGDFLFPIAVGVSAITTFTTPYMIKYSESFYNVVSRILPARVLRAIERYSEGSQDIQGENKWKTLSKAYLSLILTNGIVVVGIVLLIVYLMVYYITPFAEEKGWNSTVVNLVSLIFTVSVCAPFLWAILIKKPANDIFRSIWNENKYFRGPLFVLELSRFAVVILLVGMILNFFFSGAIASLIVIPVIIVGLYLLSTKFDFFYSLITKRFMFNLNERDLQEQAENKKNETKVKKNTFSLWDTHLTDFEVNPNADYAGYKLSELAWREKFGINIAYIKRGEKVIPIPKEDDKVFPFDKLGLIGTDEQLRMFEQNVQKGETPGQDLLKDITLIKFTVSENSPVLGKTNKYLRENTQGLIIGIEREDNKILNPASNTVLELGDIVWIAGDKKEINSFVQKPEA